MIAAAERVEILDIPLRQVRAFAGQPRKKFDAKELQALADSIGTLGQLVPGIVRRLKENPRHRWELVDGERRYRACQLAGIPTFRAFPQHVKNEAHQFELSIAANFGRSEHTPLEIAFAIRTLRDAGRTFEGIAKVFGKSLSWVARYVKLANLSPAVQALLQPEDDDAPRLGLSAAVMIADLPTCAQLEAAREAMDKGLGVFAVARQVRKIGRKHGLTIGRKVKPCGNWRAVRRLAERLEREASGFADLSDDELAAMFAGRTNRELEQFVDRPAAAAVQVHKVCARIGRLCRHALDARAALQRAG